MWFLLLEIKTGIPLVFPKARYPPAIACLGLVVTIAESIYLSKKREKKKWQEVVMWGKVHDDVNAYSKGLLRTLEGSPYVEWPTVMETQTQIDKLHER